MGRSRRQVGHTGANAVVLGYLVAAAVELVTGASGASPTWLIVHLLMLGAATNAIVTWTSHFVGALLQQQPLPAAFTLVRVVVLNVGVVAVLIGVSEDWWSLTIAGAALVTAVIIVHLGTLARAVHVGRARRFAGSMRFYWAASVAVLFGIGLGVTMVVGDLSLAWYGRVYVTHVHVGLLGWVTLTVLGTEFSLWPTALRTRMVPGTEQAARWALIGCASGLTLIVVGLLAWNRAVAELGLAGYLVGIVVFAVPFVRTGLQRPPYTPSTVMLAASTVWLLVGLVVDAVAVAGASDPTALSGDVMGFVPWLLTGFVIQVLLGALSYLIPIVLSTGPALGRRRAAMLRTWWIARVVMLNLGTVMIAVPEAGYARIGWLLVTVVIVAFAVLSLATVFIRTAEPGSWTRPRKSPTVRARLPRGDQEPNSSTSPT
ncbi:MAG: hypothetical protein ABI232_07225 [Jatrophihabitantaceae bacterium]